MADRREPTDAQARQATEKFLVEFLPAGTPQEYHDLLLDVLASVRASIARRIRGTGRPEA